MFKNRRWAKQEKPMGPNSDNRKFVTSNPNFRDVWALVSILTTVFLLGCNTLLHVTLEGASKSQVVHQHVHGYTVFHQNVKIYKTEDKVHIWMTPKS